MKVITAEQITEAVRHLCIRANQFLPMDLKKTLDVALECESSPTGHEVLQDLIQNYRIAQNTGLPICQDTGIAVVFVELGQEVEIRGGYFEDAINEGVRQGYADGYLRKSIVADPMMRQNTDDNTPAIIHTRIVMGASMTITVAPKGAGSENMSVMKMFTPSASREDIIQFVVDAADKAGSKACPPMVIGVGIGGNFETCPLLAKKALCRDLYAHNKKLYYTDLENDMLNRINRLGIGPQGFGGDVTALAVNIEEAPTHIASLPVAVNIGCHVTRHATQIL